MKFQWVDANFDGNFFHLPIVVLGCARNVFEARWTAVQFELSGPDQEANAREAKKKRPDQARPRRAAPAHSFLSKPKSYKIWQKITRLNAAHLPRGVKQQRSSWGKTPNMKRKSEQGLELKLVKIWLGLDKWPARISSEKKSRGKERLVDVCSFWR